MAQIAENQVLWNSLKREAMAKHPSHGHLGQLSPAAASELSNRYNSMGGQYVDSLMQVPQQFRDRFQDEADRKQRIEEKKRKAGLL